MTCVDIPGFTVIGIQARTSNAKESTRSAIIPKQWQRFFGEALASQIQNKSGPNFYAVYTEYASDHNGEYTYLVGTPVTEGTQPPSGLVRTCVPAGRYAVFTTEKGPFAKVVPAAWQHIFTLEDRNRLQRSYTTDFEVYDQRAQDAQNGQLDIYIGIR
jgi:predicted transcriptional regulator YdeE